MTTFYGWTSVAYFDRNGPKRPWVKLGRKKIFRQCWGDLAAVPVADSRNTDAKVT